MFTKIHVFDTRHGSLPRELCGSGFHQIRVFVKRFLAVRNGYFCPWDR